MIIQEFLSIRIENNGEDGRGGGVERNWQGDSAVCPNCADPAVFTDYAM